MDSKETHQQQNPNAAASAAPTSTSQATHHPLTAGTLSLPLRQPQPQQALMLNASPYSVVPQQPSMQLGTERPRKYAPPNVIDGGDSSGGAANANNSSSDPPAKRVKLGRPPGSRNKHKRNAIEGEEEGGAFTAHIINVNAGEDIATKLMAFMNQEPRDVCILSALGAVSTAVLQSGNPVRVVKFEGLYDITCMSGVFLNTESNGGTVTRSGNVSVSMASPDLETVGGCVGGMLVAASPVQVTVGTFGPERVKLIAASAPANVLSTSGGGGTGFSQSQGLQHSSESSEENGSKSPVGN